MVVGLRTGGELLSFACVVRLDPRALAELPLLYQVQFVLVLYWALLRSSHNVLRHGAGSLVVDAIASVPSLGPARLRTRQHAKHLDQFGL